MISFIVLEILLFFFATIKYSGSKEISFIVLEI